MKNLLLPLLLLPLIIYGQNFPLKPKNYVTTFDPFFTKKIALNQQEEELLNAKLHAFQDSTGIQLLIYLTLTGPISQESQETLGWEIFDAWGIGQKGKENGALISIFSSDRKFTMVGHGLEAILPYDVCMEILDEEMKPHFQDQNLYQGINASIDKFIYYSKHQYEPPSFIEKIKKNKMEIIGVGALTLPFIIGIIGLLLKNRSRD